MRSDLYMIGGECQKSIVVGIEHDIPAQPSEFNEESFPAFLPEIGSYLRNNEGVKRSERRGQSPDDVVVELSPVLGEINCAPRARCGGEIWCVGKGEIVK
jgi:hypothetical protein